MDGGGEVSSLPAAPDAATRPPIGVDQWVAEAEGRRAERSRLRRAWERVPGVFRLAVFVAFACVM